MGVHAASPFMADWHSAYSAELALPVLHDIDDVVGSFVAAESKWPPSRLKIGSF
jgi:hypothetical protein